jgi:hypothetical protein
VETGEEIGEEIEKKCKLFCCISAECAATFIRSSSLKNHLETKSHYYGKSGATHTQRRKKAGHRQLKEFQSIASKIK